MGAVRAVGVVAALCLVPFAVGRSAAFLEMQSQGQQSLQQRQLALSRQAEQQAEVAAANGLGEVIEILKTMLKEFDEGAKDDKDNWEEYSEWSDESETDKRENIQEQKALKMATQGTLSSAKQELAKLIEEISELDDAIKESRESLAELIELRKEEKAAFDAGLADVTKTIRAVTKATEVLENHYSPGAAELVQIRERVQLALTVYGAPKSATQENVQELAAFLQTGEGAREDAPDFLKVSGDKYASYEKQGGAKGVIGMLTDLKTNLVADKQELIAKEDDNRRQYETTKHAKETELKGLVASHAQKTERKGACEATIEQCKVTIDECKKDIKDSEIFLQQLLVDRKKYGDEYKRRVAMRNDEQAATQAALDALQAVSSGAREAVEGGFLQVSSRSTGRRSAAVAATLRAAGARLGSVTLLQVASRMRMRARSSLVDGDGDAAEDMDPDYMDAEQAQMYDQSKFSPVINLLKDLIERLETEMNAEATQHEWCETEKETSVKAKKERDAALHEYKSEIESLTTTIDQLKSEILAHQKEIARVKKETEKAKKLRASEKKTFEKAKADHEEVIGAIKTALGALGGQYGLLQVSDAQGQVPGQEPVFKEYSQGSGAGSAMEMLQDLESRYSKALAELISDENDAIKEHAQLLKDNAKIVADNTENMNMKMAERREKLTLLNQQKVDMKTTLLELHEVNNYLKDLRPSCDDIRSTFEERKKRREAEIAALQEALEVLSDPTAGEE